MTASNAIELVEVSPRDGLQNEKKLISTEDKVSLINRAVDAGVRRIEVASFVNPRRVPQMADGAEVLEALPDRDDVTYVGLVLNMRGLERLIETKADEAGAVIVLTDTFSIKNQGTTYEEGVKVAADIIDRAKAEGKAANVTLSAVFGCPFEGEVSVDRVVDAAKRIADHEPREIALADTIGVGQPWQVAEIVNAVKEAVPGMPLRAHFHNTRNTGIANAYAAVQNGVVTLDASIGGIGGCPFAPAATGNIPTEDLLYMLERAGVKTGVSLDGLIETAEWLTGVMEKTLPGMVSKAGGFPTGEAAVAAE